MTAEPFSYRARKWATQRLTSVRQSYEQHDRLAATDWDALVVLDACRYDVLRDLVPWPVESCQSPESATPQWLEECEKTRVLEGAHVATANLQYDGADVGAAALHRVWEDHWVPRLGTVTPEPVMDVASDLLADGRRPVVAHVLPPHAPYVAKLEDTWVPAGPDPEIWKRNPNVEDEADKLSPQVAMASGHVDMRKAIGGYRASVASTWDVVTEYVGRWLGDGLEVVLTADHGECFGRLRDWGFYGHPSRCHIDPLTTVPYVEFTPGDPPESTPDGVEEKLEALGYV